MAHLAQHSAVGAGDAFHGPGGAVGVEAAVVGGIAVKVGVLGSNLAVGCQGFDLLVGGDEAAFAVADGNAVEVSGLAGGKARGTWWIPLWW